MILHLSRTCLPLSPVPCGYAGRMILHLSPICLPLSPLCGGCSGRMILHLSPTCHPLSPVCCGCSARMILHLAPVCFPLSPVPCGCAGRSLPLVSRLFPLAAWERLARTTLNLLRTALAQDTTRRRLQTRRIALFDVYIHIHPPPLPRTQTRDHP